MPYQEVDARAFVSVHEFEDWMSPKGEPLLVKGWMDNWPAMEKWDLSFFQNKCGDQLVTVSPTLVKPEVSFVVALREYIDYIRSGAQSKLHNLQVAANLTHPLYAYSFKPFEKWPELLEDFSLPIFVEDWFSRFSRSFRMAHFPYQQGWVLLGPKDVCSHLHQDAYATITWLAQLRGRKRCVFFSPRDSSYLYRGSVDPLAPDLDSFPELGKAKGYECVLEPGEMVFLPPNWWHHVVALEDSITLSFNIVNQINIGQYLRHAYKKNLPKILESLPPSI